jgi:hypothetical protein
LSRVHVPLASSKKSHMAREHGADGISKDHVRIM